MTSFELDNMPVNEIQTLINRLQAEVEARESRVKNMNEAALRAAIKNLHGCVGCGYTGADYYAPERYYMSKEDGTAIHGIKNIRDFYGEVENAPDNCKFILVKLISPAGRLIPEQVKVGEVEYKMVFSYSHNYEEEIDY